MTIQSFLDGRVQLYCGDCRDVLKTLADSSIDSVVTDPPYALASIVKRFANSPRNERTENIGNPYGRTGRGFMGETWDTGAVAFDLAFWTDVFRVLKPGGHLLAMGGTRTYQRLACAIEDAGFEIRDCIQWIYGSGFPKSRNIGNGWGTALKPACEMIALARKPLIGTVAANVQAYGTGALNIDQCRVGFASEADLAGDTFGNGSARRGGIMGENIPGRGEAPANPAGRWPANLLHDGSDEVMEAFAAFGEKRNGGQNSTSVKGDGMFMAGSRETGATRFAGDTGTAARFFYTAKADSDDRIGSKHPTVKPVDLLQYLVRLVTPPGGTVLDPFAGTGTTGEAAYREGFNAVLIEREEHYQADIARRMALVVAGPHTKRHSIIKAKGKVDTAGPLFDEWGE